MVISSDDIIKRLVMCIRSPNFEWLFWISFRDQYIHQGWWLLLIMISYCSSSSHLTVKLASTYWDASWYLDNEVVRACINVHNAHRWSSNGSARYESAVGLMSFLKNSNGFGWSLSAFKTSCLSLALKFSERTRRKGNCWTWFSKIDEKKRKKSLPMPELWENVCSSR